jgi:hypothetical protein
MLSVQVLHANRRQIRFYGFSVTICQVFQISAAVVFVLVAMLPLSFTTQWKMLVR